MGLSDEFEDDEESSVNIKGLRYVREGKGCCATKLSRLGGGETIGSVEGRVTLERLFLASGFFLCVVIILFKLSEFVI